MERVPAVHAVKSFQRDSQWIVASQIRKVECATQSVREELGFNSAPGMYVVVEGRAERLFTLPFLNITFIAHLLFDSSKKFLKQ